MPMLPLFLISIGAVAVLTMIAFAFAGPSPQRAGTRRLNALRERHSTFATGAVEAQMRRITGKSATKADIAAMRYLPKPAELKKRLAMTGKTWTVGQYGTATLGITAFVGFGFGLILGLPILLALFIGLILGLGIPHLAVNFLIKRRVGKFTAKFPDALELLVRGLRSGLPITETMSVVGAEVAGPVGEEFRSVSDKMKIGRSMDAALQETADRLGTPEFQFFVITLAIQRETGGNLAETLQNLATVLRQRGQMKLKIKAMSSESKASAYIIGALPFIVFVMIWFINGAYMQTFFTDQRLMVAGGGGIIWMAIGAFIMAKMINFEI
ncbi:type II secretion system F family protein [Sphingomonas sp. SUN019]|uniref:type II secretion system F family protein n=1 Tax=Sphingomonas sp. SUN019 TaxID=2937788 RepID=UPI002164CA8A|nr:type II secretion system F family protein [Sphingomonas sp. SUN019]UVO49816.1 type II secretion system F family protein [Sphingomonas sp. SUN019]